MGDIVRFYLLLVLAKEIVEILSHITQGAIHKATNLFFDLIDTTFSRVRLCAEPTISQRFAARTLQVIYRPLRIDPQPNLCDLSLRARVAR